MKTLGLWMEDPMFKSPTQTPLVRFWAGPGIWSTKCGYREVIDEEDGTGGTEQRTVRPIALTVMGKTTGPAMKPGVGYRGGLDGS